MKYWYKIAEFEKYEVLSIQYIKNQLFNESKVDCDLFIKMHTDVRNSPKLLRSNSIDQSQVEHIHEELS